MRNIAKLMAWHWRLVRGSYAVLCAVYAVQQLVLLMAAALDSRRLGYQMAELFQGCGQMPLFFIAMYAVAVLAAHATRRRERAQNLYTLYTMPFSRGTLWTAQFMLGLILLEAFAAWQILLYMLAYFPVTMASSRVAAGMMVGALPWNSLLEEVNANPLMQLLLPVKLGSGFALLGLLGITALHSACMACCHGIRRAAVTVLALFGTGAACIAFYVRYHQVTYGTDFQVFGILLVVLLTVAFSLAAVNVFQALRALKRAETA